MGRSAGIAAIAGLAALALSACGAPGAQVEGQAKDTVPSIFTDPIPVYEPDFNDISKQVDDEWVLSDKTSGNWNLCVSLPTLKDPYWLAANYGLVTQAQRLGIEMTILDAGGYDQLPKQISDLEDCVASGADAILVAAVSGEGVQSKIDQIVADGIPVIEAMNRVGSPNVTARATQDFYPIGEAAAKRLLKTVGNEPTRIAWFPGPEGAAWAVRQDQGFKDALKGTSVDIVATKWGDTDRGEQTRLIEDTLQAESELDWIVGVAPAAESAHGPLVEAGRDSEIKVASTYQTTGVADAVSQGTVHSSGNDNIVWVAAIAVDMAIRHLDGEDMTGTEVWPKPTEFSFDSPVDPVNNAGFAPKDFKPIFKVG